MYFRTNYSLALVCLTLIYSSAFAEGADQVVDKSDPYYKYRVELPSEQTTNDGASVYLEFFANSSGDIASVEFNSMAKEKNTSSEDVASFATTSCKPRKVCVTPTGPCGWVGCSGPIAPDGMQSFFTAISSKTKEDGDLEFSVDMMSLNPEIPNVRFDLSENGNIELK